MRLLVFFTTLLLTFSALSAAKEMRLNWEHKQLPTKHKDEHETGCVPTYHTGGDLFAGSTCDGGTVKIHKVYSKRDKLEFDAVIHNINENWYQCFYMTTSENHVHIDDDLGDEYKGLKLKFKDGQDNKLALNQRKKIKIIIPKPLDDAGLANVHFGFYFNNVKPGQSCLEPIGDYGINFNKLDWDISELVGK